MKKLLALVLALVMTLGLATVSASASAKTFADDADITYKEAVDVLSGVGVLSGMGENKFAPKEELTRAQAAKIIAYLDLGETAAENLPASKTFSDVPADHWASKYIAYCYSAGIVGGVGGGNFDPDGKLTGYAFGKMLLVVLGYDTKIEGFSGNDWMINVASVMNTANIGDDVDKAGTLVLTREEAAEYALDALKADVVKYDNKGTTINTTDGTSVVVGSSKAEAVERNNEGAKNYADNGDGEDYQQLCEKRYGTDLKFKGNNAEDFGRPTSGKWFYKNEEITDAVVNTDDLVLTSTGKVTFGDLYSAIGTTALNAIKAGGENNQSTLTLYIDGAQITETAQNQIEDAATHFHGYLNNEAISKNSSTAFGYYGTYNANAETKYTNKVEPTDKGTLTEVYKQENNGVYTVTIVVINTYLAQATDDYDADDKELDIKLVDDYNNKTWYGLNNEAILDADNDTLDLEDFAVIADVKEDDYLLVTIAGGEVKSVVIPQLVKDVKISVFKGYDSLTADGTAYKYSKKAVEQDEVTTGDEVDLVLDTYGKIISVKDADGKNTVSDYVFIKKVAQSGFDYQAELVFLSDGSKKTVTVAQTNDTDVGDGEIVALPKNVTHAADGTTTPDAGQLCANFFATYKVKSNGEYKLTYKPTFAAANNSVIDYSKFGVYAFGTVNGDQTNANDVPGNTKTVFLAKDKVYTGVKNAPKVAASAVYYTVKDNFLEAVYSGTKGSIKNNADDIVFILKSADGDFSKGQDADDNDYYVVDAVVDGSKTSYTISDGSKTKIEAGNKGLYIIDSYDGDYPELLRAKNTDNAIQAAKVEKVGGYDNGTLFVAYANDGNEAKTNAWTLADDVKIYTIDTKDSNKTQSISAGSIKSKLNADFTTAYLVLSDEPTAKDATIKTLYLVKGIDPVLGGN